MAASPSDANGDASSHDDIHEAFRTLREARAARPQRAAAEEHPADDRAVVEAASAHTLESIVEGLAEVQLRFDRSVEELIDTLTEEVTTLRTTRRAIDVETRRIEKLRNLKIAADALDLLKREHDEDLQALEEEHRAQREALDREITEQRTAWEKDRSAFEERAQQREEELQQEGAQAEEEYRYKRERERRKELDAFEEEKRETERRLQEQEDEKEADWAEREAALEARQDRRVQYKEQLASFQQEKADAVETARNEARVRAKEEAEAEAVLYAEEVAAKRNSYETRIELLEADVERQSALITQRSNQLQSALQQTQRLAARAMGPDDEPPETA